MRAGRYLALLVALLSARALGSEAVELLQRMSDSARQLDYRGTLVYDRGAGLETLEIRHALRDGRERELLRYLNGRERVVQRDGAHVVCRQGEGVAAHPQRAGGLFGNLGGMSLRLQQLASYYDVKLVGADRVAGRPVNVLVLQPRDVHRYGYRFDLDRETGLLLGAQSLTADGRPLEQVRFISFEPGAAGEFPPLEAPGQAQAPSAPEPVSVPAISARWLPPGFAPADASGQDASLRRGAEAMRFSDGLAVFSIFVEAMRGAVPPAYMQQGATLLVSRPLSGGGRHYSVTLVGELPAETAEAVLSGLEFAEVRP